MLPVCEGGWTLFVGEASLPEGLSAVELFNQREDHILVKVYLPVAIS